MTPTQIGAEWFIIRGTEQLAGPFQSNSDAWRWIDRAEGETVGVSEEKSDPNRRDLFRTSSAGHPRRKAKRRSGMAKTPPS